MDSSNSVPNNPPRQAPSPTAAQHQTNGVNGPAVGLLNSLPSAGHQADMNHLWSVVQQLSDVLAENRAQTVGIVNSMQQIQARAATEGESPTISQVNGELNGTYPAHASQQQAPTTLASASRAAELAAAQAQLGAAQRRIGALETGYGDMNALLSDYENAIGITLERLRPYAYQHTQAIIALHAHYNSLLDAERTANLHLRLEYQKWQAGLGRVANYARLALRSDNEGTLPYLRKIAALKTENRVLRSLAGWESPDDESGDEMIDQWKEAAMRDNRKQEEELKRSGDVSQRSEEGVNPQPSLR